MARRPEGTRAGGGERDPRRLLGGRVIDRLGGDEQAQATCREWTNR
ncbi:hypothetical protein [Streptosporangium sp. KLBMP 9127]|nr:hypothetical protein [Streptosporangium sp. KLBMP 9127]